MSKNWNFNTKLIHGGVEPDKATGATGQPIYQSAAYAYDTAKDLEDVFAGRQFGHIYSRISNPTVFDLEKRITVLENGVASAALSSGMAAISAVVMALCESGDEIVSSQFLFGGSYDYFDETAPKMGINVRYVDSTDINAVRDAVTNKTRFIFVETIANPKTEVSDIKALSDLAHEKGIPLVVDSTMTSPYLFDSKAFGADVVIHSATKYMSGNGGVIAGFVVDTGLFNWKDCLSPDVAIAAKRMGQFALIDRVRWHGLHNCGATLAPMNAYMIHVGLETMGLRVQRQSDNAEALARFLDEQDAVKAVNHPRLDGHKQQALAHTQFPLGCGSVFSFELHSKESAYAVIDGLKLAKNMANLGDTRTMVIHPGSTIYQRRPEQQQQAAGVTPEMIRVSVGIEDINDLIEDFKQALGGA
ncbi:O-acetylhomoserine aminocarboxypropyltransferase/cysteine synthase [bacterium]|jgi:O-acetylhomoserine (thiol)-lyase|nr:O-acetylhomoserine aminocarboxypropyltransferase/cysteine synthase [bacterium]